MSLLLLLIIDVVTGILPGIFYFGKFIASSFYLNSLTKYSFLLSHGSLADFYLEEDRVFCDAKLKNFNDLHVAIDLISLSGVLEEGCWRTGIGGKCLGSYILSSLIPDYRLIVIPRLRLFDLIDWIPLLC